MMTRENNPSRSLTAEQRQTSGQVKPGYKKTPIGIIPEDWEVKRVDNFTNCTSGGTPSTKIDEYWNGDIPWMNSGELNKRIVLNTDNFITQKGLENSSTKFIPKNSVLIGLAGQGKTRGTVAINKIRLCVNQSIGAFLPNKSYNYKYLFYYLDSRYHRIRALSSGDGGRGGLNLKILHELKVTFPKKAEQKLIADCLSTWDVGIEKLTQLIAAKKQQKKGLMQKLLTGTLRMTSASGEKFDGEWKEVRLGDVTSIIKGEQLNRKNLTETGIYPSYSGGIIPSGYTDRFNQKSNTITISEGGNSCGYVNYVTVNFWLGGHCYAIEPEEEIDKIFLYNLLKHNEPKIMILRVGSGLPNVQKGDLSKFKIVIPSFQEQTAIAKILQSADKEIELLEQKLSAFQEQKKGLMQVLLTGALRLRSA